MMSLKEYLTSANRTQREFASAVGVSPSYLNEIVKGSKSPSLALAVKIEQESKGCVAISSLSASRGAA